VLGNESSAYGKFSGTKVPVTAVMVNQIVNKLLQLSE